jgi:murein L,D-transpeptidase YcbB/YkuD
MLKTCAYTAHLQTQAKYLPNMPRIRLLLPAFLPFMIAIPCAAQDLPCEAAATALATQMHAQAAQQPAPQAVKLRALKPGQRASWLPELRARLGLEVEGGYDAALEQAVAENQAQLGFTPTGALDSPTLLNLMALSAKYRAQVAEQAAVACRRVNTELARTLPSRFIEVNVAAQQLIAYERDERGVAVEVMRSRVIAGGTGTKTPLEDFTLWGLKFNPGWTPTSNILARNVVKGGSVNRRWLASHNMRITNSAGQKVSASEVTPSNWRQLRFSEPSGPGAALGAWKFETTSTQNIYMHDTPEKAKFERNERLASSGCVRVQDIEALARWAYDATEEGSAQANAFDKLSDTGKNTIKRLDTKIPVFLTYRLVDWDTDGHVVYFADGYGRAPAPVTVDVDN